MISYCLISSLFTPKVRILRRGKSYIFGRDKTIDFPIPSDVVSRRHAELAWSKDGGFQVTDLGSKNGTRVNNVPVLAPHALREGDMVTMGQFSFQYREYRGDIAALMDEPGGDELETTAAIDGEAIAHLARVRAGLAPVAPPEGFAGNFQGVELLEICRLIGAGERDGILTITSDSIAGQLGFLKGEIRRAIVPGGQGEAAALALLSLPSGRFEFTQGSMTLERNCRCRPDSLSMEVARRQDELAKATSSGAEEAGASARAKEPPSGPPPRTAPAEAKSPARGGDKEATGPMRVNPIDELQVEPTERISPLSPDAVARAIEARANDADPDDPGRGRRA